MRGKFLAVPLTAEAKQLNLEAQYRQIAEMLAQGKTQPQIGRALRLHRSAVWRRIRKMKALASQSPGPSTQ